MAENRPDERPLTAKDYYSRGGIEEVKKRFFQRPEGNSRPYKVLEERPSGVDGVLIAINYVDKDGNPIEGSVDWISREQHLNHPEYVPKISLEATLKVKRLSN